MFPFKWILLSCLLAPGEADLPELSCDTNHTQIFLFVDLVYQDRSLTITRVKNIVTYFTTKVKAGIIKTLDVSLMDPVQGEKIFNLTNVTTSGEILSAIHQPLDLKTWRYYFNIPDEDVLNEMCKYANTFLHHVISEEIPNKQQIVVIFLLPCFISCMESIYYFSDNLYIAMYPNFLTLFLLSVTSVEESKRITREYLENKYEKPSKYFTFVHNKNDFNWYNPVIINLCKDCPKAWTRYNWGDHIFSCFFVDMQATPISWKQATKSCASLESALPNIETEDELTYLKDLISNRTTILSTDHSTTGMSTETVVNVGLIERLDQSYYLWTNLRPFTLNTNVVISDDTKDRCVALSFPLDARNSKDNIKLMKINCDDERSKILVCEMEFGMRNRLLRHKLKIKEMWKSSLQTVELEKTERHSNTEISEDHEMSSLMFNCQDGVNLIPYDFVCDGARDCRNGRDEEFCNTVPKLEKLNTFLCSNPNGLDYHPTKISISSNERCNFIQDCPDNSDELGCDGCLDKKCGDGTCVPSHWLSRDSQECPLFIGANGTAYLDVSHECQGRFNGLGWCSYEISFCNTDINLDDYSEGQTFYNNIASFVEWAPKCIYLKGSGGRPMGCINKNHLRDCRTFVCPVGFLKCPDSYCVPLHYFNDKMFDCPYGEDEESELNIYWLFYKKGLYNCKKTNMLIHRLNTCDGVPQCLHNDDEIGCPVNCPPGFKCQGHAVQVNDHTQVRKITSLNIFDINTKFLNMAGIDLSNLNNIYYFPNLIEIHASNCNITDLNKLFDIFNTNNVIYVVNFSFNKLTKIMNHGPLASLRNLQHLSLSHNEQLTEIKPFGIWSPKLQILDLSFTAISVLKLDVLQEFNTLRYLDLRNTKLVEIGSFLFLKNLDYLNLENTSLVPKNMTKILKYVNVSSALYIDNYKYCCPQISTGGTPKQACHAPPVAISSCEDLLSDVLKRSLLWLVAGVSFAGNIIVVTYRLFYDRGVFKKGYGVFVTNLSVSDFIMGVYLLIIASTDVRYRDEYVLHESVWKQSSLCQAAGFLSTLSSETSTFFVFLITLDRFLVIRFPFGDHRFTKLGLVLSVLSAWMFGFILALVPLIYPQWIIYSSNGMCLGLPLASEQHPGWHYSFGLFICFNFTLFLFIACGQIFIFRLIFSGQKFQMTNAQSVARRVQDINVAKQLFLVVISNFLCWFPICVLGFMSLTGHEVSTDTYAWLVVFVMPLNAAVNPMIYTVPVMYRKWQDFKKGQPTGNRPRSQINNLRIAETNM